MVGREQTSVCHFIEEEWDHVGRRGRLWEGGSGASRGLEGGRNQQPPPCRASTGLGSEPGRSPPGPGGDGAGQGGDGVVPEALPGGGRRGEARRRGTPAVRRGGVLRR